MPLTIRSRLQRKTIYTPTFYNTGLSFGPQLMELRAPNLSMDENLATNLMYGAEVCRLCYYRKPDALPEAGDIESQAAFWKQHHNTPLGKGTVTKYVYKVQKILKEA